MGLNVVVAKDGTGDRSGAVLCRENADEIHPGIAIDGRRLPVCRGIELNLTGVSKADSRIGIQGQGPPGGGIPSAIHRRWILQDPLPAIVRPQGQGEMDEIELVGVANVNRVPLLAERHLPCTRMSRRGVINITRSASSVDTPEPVDRLRL